MSRQATASFALLALALHDQPSAEDTLDVLVASAPAALGCDGAGVLLHRRGSSYRVAAATDGVAREVDALQVRLQQGPGLTALREQCTVQGSDLLRDERWPQWSSQATSLGVRSVLAVLLRNAGSTAGVLTLSWTRPHRVDDHDVALAEVLARHAAVALAGAREHESLRTAVDARKLVGQAQGILMERYDLDDERAFEVLRRYSQDLNLKLNEVARALIETRRLPDGDGRPGEFV